MAGLAILGYDDKTSSGTKEISIPGRQFPNKMLIWFWNEHNKTPSFDHMGPLTQRM